MKTKQHKPLSFVRYFNMFARKQLNNSSRFIEIVPFAKTLNAKANLLLKIALFEDFLDQFDLLKELFESGQHWVKQYSVKFRPEKSR